MRDLLKYDVFVDLSKVARVNDPFRTVQGVMETYDNVHVECESFKLH